MLAVKNIRNEFCKNCQNWIFCIFTGVEISKFSLLPKRDIKKRGSSIIKVLKAERVERRGELLLKSNLTCGLWCTFDELSLFIAQLHHQYQAHHNRQVSLLQEKKTGCTGGKKKSSHINHLDKTQTPSRQLLTQEFNTTGTDKKYRTF